LFLFFASSILARELSLMSESNDPRTPPSIGVSTPLPSGAADSVGVISLPPAPAPQWTRDDAIVAAKAYVLDVALSVLVLFFAFLLASLPARNSDLWMHLASGRLLADGQYQIGVDPFAFTSSGIYWVNHSWLSDLLAYAIFQTLGGTILVVLKGLLVVLLAWAMLRLCQTTAGRGSGWVAAVFVALSLLALGPWLPMQPICLSYLFLGLTLWFLEARASRSDGTSLITYWPLLLLFVLWANVDAWFVLGPATVGLYGLGQLLQGRGGMAQARTLGIVFLASLVVCLLNPHHYHVFALPAQLGFSGEANTLADDPVLGRLFLSPFDSDYFHLQNVRNVGRLAYFPLVLLGLISFAVLGTRGQSFRRVLTWLFFFALSAYNAWTIPFFAIVAGPIAALNFQEFAHRREKERSPVLPPPGPLWTLGGRLLTLVSVLLLLGTAWPGWLQGQPYERRAWSVKHDRSLENAARQLEAWRKARRFGADDRGFNFAPETAAYLAWFAPQEKGFFDSRWRVCAPAGADYVTVRRALLGEARPDEDWRGVLRARHVTHLILHDGDTRRVAQVWQRLAAQPREWPILFLEGDTVVVGWRDPQQPQTPDSFAGWEVDFDKLAFHPTEEKQAPGSWPGREPRGPGLEDLYWKAAPRSLNREEAALHLVRFEGLKANYLSRSSSVWRNSLGLNLVATSGATGVPGDHPFAFALRFQLVGMGLHQPAIDADANVTLQPIDLLAPRFHANFLARRDDGPPASLFLAIRAARRALHVNPDDANTYLILGEAYSRLALSTRERVLGSSYPRLLRLRLVQAIAALEQAVKLQPHLVLAHAGLAELYHEMGFVDPNVGFRDLILKHREEQLKHERSAGPRRGESADAFAQRMQSLEEQVKQLRVEVSKRSEVFEVNAANLKVYDRARQACQKGLAGKALEILLASDFAVFGIKGMALEFDLLLATGRVKDVREWMNPEQKDQLGLNYYWLNAQMAAASGDYDRADEDLAAMLVRGIRKSETNEEIMPFRTAIALGFTQAILSGQQSGAPILGMGQRILSQIEIYKRTDPLFGGLRQDADVMMLRGLLALEVGRAKQATTHFRKALALWKDENAAAEGSGLEFAGREIAQRYLKLLSSDKKGS
jgi:tetratricopeptide (TPR) repeat protein